MLIYHNTTEQFARDVRTNCIGDIIETNYKTHFGRKPGSREMASWQNSLPRVRDVIEIAELKNNIIAVEYEVPYNQNRIDCLLFGKDQEARSNIVLIELKQWSSVEASEADGNFVETYTGGASRTVAHPSQQVQGYHNYLKSFVTEFESEPPLLLFSCSYCHNYEYSENEGLYNPKYLEILRDYPIFNKKDTMALAEKIKYLLSGGDGFEIFNRFMQSPIRPTKKLLDHVSKIIKSERVFSLLNEQLVAKNLIWANVRKAEKNQDKSVLIVQGGPGTGKSVIALNILAEAAGRGMKVFYGCKSKPFYESLKSLVGKNSEALFSNLYRFLPSVMAENELDLLLIDEAHRIEKKSNHQYTKPEHRTDMPQIDQLVRCAKTSVFFIDDKQNVRYQEIGKSDLIREAALKYGRKTYEVQLLNQFRCMGSNDYLLWIESVLGYSIEKRSFRINDVFDFKIFNSPRTIYEELQKREKEKANSARMVAGFCWPWSKTLDRNGQLHKDIKIGDFEMPWETHSKISKPPKGYVRWYEWAYRPDGFKQVGCIYTAQGFEFDYIGVIIGDDLKYDPQGDRLTADLSATKDPTLKRGKEKIENHIKNIYRTLLTRGMKGCYVYFVNKETERYFKERMEIYSVETMEYHKKPAKTRRIADGYDIYKRKKTK